jgi:hypothetical protein
MEKYTHKSLLIIATDSNWPIGYARDEDSAQRLTDTLNAWDAANTALWEKVQKLEAKLEINKERTP